MAELSQQERLQPSLLDRLTDERPHENAESREARVINTARLRECVVRDIGWLLNCTRHWNEEALESMPFVEGTVLNYGIPDLAGMALMSLSPEALEARLRNVIVAFEPRLDEDSLQVKAHVSGDRMDQRALSFTIEAEMWAHPMPLNLYLRTDIDLESGHVSVTQEGQ